MFSTIVSPRFGDIDGLGHVNNTVLPVWFEIGRNSVFRLFSPDLDLSPDVWHLILVRTEFDFLHQMYFRSDVEIRTYIAKIGNSSFTVGHEAWQEGELKVKGQAVLVYYDFKLQKAIPLPDSIREILTSHMLPAMNNAETDTDSPCSI
ncbi:thioesterase family protein [Methanosarcina sp.]|jgi:acyl-CoA thioester hydrolase|uniref:acyl-CoA thioesterase n=1 Tax=Methanosarcina sp. TaxID=2213 RepID=UPI002988DCD0|nr:thioesterase family protein [Methanosarcina sp.]MDW5549647.1 thioesterase family protein [Methanosarcina sp.]MDW5552952.1 thioesterase family protein [Methanosarcina sp.]MDW5558034.1 thioesterase family protein [Methanosarcina sp.]